MRISILSHCVSQVNPKVTSIMCAPKVIPILIATFSLCVPTVIPIGTVLSRRSYEVEVEYEDETTLELKRTTDVMYSVDTYVVSKEERDNKLHQVFGADTMKVHMTGKCSLGKHVQQLSKLKDNVCGAVSRESTTRQFFFFLSSSLFSFYLSLFASFWGCCFSFLFPFLLVASLFFCCLTFLSFFYFPPVKVWNRCITIEFCRAYKLIRFSCIGNV